MLTCSFITTKTYQKHSRNFSILSEWSLVGETSKKLQLGSILKLLVASWWKDSKMNKILIRISRRSSTKIWAHYQSLKRVTSSLQKSSVIEKINGKEEWSQVSLKPCLSLLLRGLSKVSRNINTSKKFRLKRTSPTLELQRPTLWKRGICAPTTLLRKLPLTFTSPYKKTISSTTVSKCRWVVTCALSTSLSSRRSSSISRLTRVIRRKRQTSRMSCTILISLTTLSPR